VRSATARSSPSPARSSTTTARTQTGPKLVCVDLQTDTVVRTILFPTDVALPTTYLNDVRFDLRRGEAGTAYITDSSDSGPNGIIVVDLASGESWRRLHEHPATKAVTPPDTMSVAADGHLYVTANQLYRQAQYRGGRRAPHALRAVRTPIDAGPVRLG
jgi:sugar lactone lactonase YvrE